MVDKANIGLGFHGAVILIVAVPVLFFVLRRRWRLDKERRAEVRRRALFAADEDRRAELEAQMEYLALSKDSSKEASKELSKKGAKEGLMMVCAFCSVPASARCAKCKRVRYCSGKCQIAHWRQGHRDECRPPSISFKSNGRATVSMLKGEQVEQIVLIDGELEHDEQASAHVVQTFLEPYAASVVTSSSDTLDENNKLEEKTDDAPGNKITTSEVNSSEPKYSVVCSTVTQQVASVIDESILYGNTLGHRQSSHISPINPVTSVNISDLDAGERSGPVSISTHSDVNNIPVSGHLHQNESIPTVETVEDISSERQHDLTSEYEFVDLGVGEDQSSVVGTSESGSRIQNLCNLPAASESKSQSEHVATKDPSNEKSNSAVISITNNVESRLLVSKAHASSVGRLSSYSDGDAVAVSRTSQVDSASTNPSKTGDDKGPILNGVAKSAERAGNHLTLPRTSHMDSHTISKRSMDDKSSIPNGMATSVKGPVNHLTEPKTSRHYQYELMLFPYDQFIKLFNYNNIELRPSGLSNCGNSCYANVVLQCLAFTRPLTAYFLEGFHSNKCRKDDWCFTCEFERLLANVKKGKSPLSPLVILTHLDDIGGNFGHGRQEDAHEFLRFVVDAMQSICLKEAGVKPVNQLAEETTLIQQTFGGYLQSKIKCSRCKGKSERCERMMDLTVEIHGDVNTLEEALKRFTSVEILDGENKYECVRCKSYERARKRLTILEAPNILVIALKRFQSGRFCKLNKTVQFPEYLDLAPYMRVTDDKSPIYQLYAVVVHIDVLNSSQSGHYVCYVKDTRGRWYNLDDSKVRPVELEKVLSEDAYMLLYARCSPRAPSFVRKAMVHQSAKLWRSKSKGFWDKSGPLLPHLSVPAPSSNFFDFQSSDLFDDRIRPFVKGYSSDNSSLFTNSDEVSSTTDSTRDSTSTEEHWETFSSNSPFRNSEDYTHSPSALSQSSDAFDNRRNNNLTSRRHFISDVSFSGRKVDDTGVEKLGNVNFMDRGDYYPCDRYNSPSFLYYDNSKQHRNLTEHNRTVESHINSSNKVNSSVLSRRTSGRNPQPFY